MSEDRLGELRKQIDAIDAELVRLLNARAEVVVEIGKYKQGSKTPIYAPHREVEVLNRVLGLSQGPLPSRSLEGIYRELMSGSFALEQPLRVGHLGPSGSFSHVAAVAHFGSSVDFEDLGSIAGVFKEVERDHVDYGIVPIENSTGGGIVDTLDAFFSMRGRVHVYAEILVTIRHHLLANCEASAIRRIHSKPEVFAQCREWLAVHFPTAELIASSSSSQAVREAKQAHDDNPSSGTAAIGSELAGQLYGMNVLFEDVEDNPSNITRFFVLATDEAKVSGDDKTSIMFTTKDVPGALVRVLSVFEKNGINLTHIDKRPSRKENWTYSFFIDAQGHKDTEVMQHTIAEATALCQEIVVLGSYPRATRIL